MIVDGKSYEKNCACGRSHKLETEFCIIESGCMKDFLKHTAEYGLKGRAVAIYDENTYEAVKKVRPKVYKEIVLPAKDLHADNHGVALAKKEFAEDFDYLIAIGAGTVHDITRYLAYEGNVPFVSCPTAPSVDGFCSSVAAMTWDGFKKTFTARAPKIVLADLEIISQAPTYLTNSGFGDMIGKFIALADWRISNVLTREYFCEYIYDLVLDATTKVIECANDIQKGEKSAFEKLTYGLLISGIAMQLLGNSRCASGAEHHISHLIEMQPSGLNLKSCALHGEKVGVGTLLAAEEYHKIKNSVNLEWFDYICADETYIEQAFGAQLKDAIIKENRNDVCTGLTPKKIIKYWDSIIKIIEDIPAYESLIALYTRLGLKSSLNDIGVDECKRSVLLEYSPLVRNRMTLMRLARAIKKV